MSTNLLCQEKIEALPSSEAKLNFGIHASAGISVLLNQLNLSILIKFKNHQLFGGYSQLDYKGYPNADPYPRIYYNFISTSYILGYFFFVKSNKNTRFVPGIICHFGEMETKSWGNGGIYKTSEKIKWPNLVLGGSTKGNEHFDFNYGITIGAGLAGIYLGFTFYARKQSYLQKK